MIILCIQQSIVKLSLILLSILHKHSKSSNYLAKIITHVFLKPMLGNWEVKWSVSSFESKPGFCVPLPLSLVATPTCFPLFGSWTTAFSVFLEGVKEENNHVNLLLCVVMSFCFEEIAWPMVTFPLYDFYMISLCNESSCAGIMLGAVPNSPLSV